MIELHQGHVLEVLATMPEQSVSCVVASPPYWGLRSYDGVDPVVWDGEPGCEHVWGKQQSVPKGTGGHNPKQDSNAGSWYQASSGSFCQSCNAWLGCLGLEPTPALYVQHLVQVFRAVWRVLRDDGTLWLNLGDSYASQGGPLTYDINEILGGPPEKHDYQQTRKPPPGLKPKDLVGIPWRVAFALQDDGWYLRSDIIWSKPNPMPESVKGSHFTRHQVTIEEYERLSSMRIAQGLPLIGTSDMPRLQEGQVPSRQTSIPEVASGESNSTIERGTARRTGTPPSIQPFGARESQSEEIRGHRKRPNDQAQSGSTLSEQRTRQTASIGEASKDQASTGANSAETSSGTAIQPDGEGESPEVQVICKPQEGDSEGTASCSREVAGDMSATQAPLPLLQATTDTDNRPCNTLEQGRAARSGEHSSSLSPLQQPEEQPDNPTLVDCPGCPQCLKHNGYIFHLSAGRPTKSHEYMFLLSKNQRYYFDQDAVREPLADVSIARISQATFDKQQGGPKDYRNTGINPHRSTRNGLEHLKDAHERGQGRNIRSVWHIPTQPYPEAHFAVFPEKLVEPCIKAGCPEGGTVLDPFCGTGTTGLVAVRHGRRFIGIDASDKYQDMIRKRTAEIQMMMPDPS